MELILSVCLLASPGVCKDEALPMSREQATPSSTCFMAAPILIAEWCESHPKWKVVRWRCDRPDVLGKGI